MRLHRFVALALVIGVGAIFLASCGGGSTMNRYIPPQLKLIGNAKTDLPTVSRVAVFPLETTAAKAKFNIDMLSSIFFDRLSLTEGFEEIVMVNSDLADRVLKKAKADLKEQKIDAEAKLTDVRTVIKVGDLLGVEAILVGTLHMVEEVKVEKIKYSAAAMDMVLLDARKGVYDNPTELTPVKYFVRIDAKNRSNETLIATRKHEEEVAIDLINKMVEATVAEIDRVRKEELVAFNKSLADMKRSAYILFKKDKKYEEAIVGYEKVLELAPKDEDALEMIENIQAAAQAELEKEQAEAAERAADEARRAEEEAARRAAEEAAEEIQEEVSE